MENNIKEDGDGTKTRPTGINLSAETVSEETKEKAESVKEKANAFFKSMFKLLQAYYCYWTRILFLFAELDYTQAISLYTEAITLNPFVAAYYGNRSFAYLKTECFGYALNDANKALELDKAYVKVSISYYFLSDFASSSVVNPICIF